MSVCLCHLNNFRFVFFPPPFTQPQKSTRDEDWLDTVRVRPLPFVGTLVLACHSIIWWRITKLLFFISVWLFLQHTTDKCTFALVVYGLTPYPSLCNHWQNILESDHILRWQFQQHDDELLLHFFFFGDVAISNVVTGIFSKNLYDSTLATVSDETPVSCACSFVIHATLHEKIVQWRAPVLKHLACWFSSNQSLQRPLGGTGPQLSTLPSGSGLNTLKQNYLESF